MAEYIEREAAIESLPVSWDSAVNALRNMPAADVATVVHGHWVQIGADKRGRGGIFRCAACNKCSPHVSKYCPECGAKMDGGADNETD